MEQFVNDVVYRLNGKLSRVSELVDIRLDDINFDKNMSAHS